ncbi:MAG TPA: sigma-54 dependent transcriptional regulator [Bryobacteraceae bacterium]|nr:sigma-54 dependent transcriptional regulator [Bryobacteraceae bacterium]
MASVLLAWIGNTDLRAAQGDEQAGAGPIAQALKSKAYDEAFLLANYPNKDVEPFVKWLGQQSRAKLSVRHVALDRPTNFGKIYEAAVALLQAIEKDKHGLPNLTFHLSPGTPAMAAVWILLSKTRFKAELIESSKQHGVATVSVPFDISAEFLPVVFSAPDERLDALSMGLPPETAEFKDIIYRSSQMKRVVLMARRVAVRSVPVLIEGESGTGKELLARAIHHASPRSNGPFVAVNCGAIPKELFESEFFGHEKGAFTGANLPRAGHFEQADNGTLFLDEIGELPLADQVKLLRVLQEREVVRIGGSKPKKIDVRVISATNRDLLAAISDYRFREDLYYRLAVAVINVPAVREREGDLSLLIDRILEQVNRESAGEPGFSDKKLSAGAKNLMLQYRWPGNVRELLNVIRRATIWSGGPTVAEPDIADALRSMPGKVKADERGVLPPLAEGIDLPKLIERVKRRYLEEALHEAGGNKTKAAVLVGLPNYQTLTNWMKQCGME